MEYPDRIYVDEEMKIYYDDKYSLMEYIKSELYYDALDNISEMLEDKND